jgi:hypothetical protein
MNYDERKKIIAAWIEPTSGFLSRFKIPSLGDDAVRNELIELVSTINESTPLLPDHRAMNEFLHNLGREVSKRAKTRGWPLQSEFVAAIEAIRKRPAPAIAPVDSDGPADASLPLKIQHAADWFRKFGSIPNWWNTRAVCEGLINAGHCTYEELKSAHADVPMREHARHLGAEMIAPKRMAAE